MGTQSRERKANGRWRIGAREGDRRGKSWGPAETGHMVKYAGGNKGQRFPAKKEQASVRDQVRARVCGAGTGQRSQGRLEVLSVAWEAR